MHFFTSLFAKGALGVAAAGSLALGAAGIKHDDKKIVPVARPHVEIQINGMGSALVRGATVTSVSGNTIVASTALGSTTLSWTINTTSNTQFIASSTNAIGSVSVGDTVSFSGALHGPATSLTVDAKVVKDASKLPAPRVDNKDKDKSH